jgi:hypothetical protein
MGFFHSDVLYIRAQIMDTPYFNSGHQENLGHPIKQLEWFRVIRNTMFTFELLLCAGANVSIPVLYAFNYVDELVLILWLFVGSACCAWIISIQLDASECTIPFYGRNSDNFYTGYNTATFYKVINTILGIIAFAHFIIAFLLLRSVHWLNEMKPREEKRIPNSSEFSFY